MTNDDRLAALLAALEADTRLDAFGCEVAQCAPACLSIGRRGHHLGMWCLRGDAYEFTPGGYAVPTTTAERVEDAVEYMTTFVASLPTRRM